MRISYLYPQWKPGRHSYAMDVLGRGLAGEMAARHEVALFARGKGSEFDGLTQLELVGHGLDRVASPITRRSWSALGRLHLIPASRPINSTIWAFPGYALASARRIREMNADVAHVHIYEQLVPLIRRSSPETGIVLHAHDHSQLQQDEATVGKRLAMADLIVGCSDYMANAIADRFPTLADRITSIPNSIPEPWPERQEPEGRGAIVFVGRLSPEKGVHVLVEAFNDVGSRFPDATLTLIGPGAVPGPAVVDSHLQMPAFQPVRHFFGQGRAFKRYLADLVAPELRDRVEFVGEVTNVEATKRLLSADLLVMPSIWNEPFGMPVLEGMAAGLPVVATRAGAFPDTIEEGVTGLLVSPGDVPALAEAIESVLSDPSVAVAMGEAGRARAATRFGWRQYIDSWAEAYDSLV